MSRRPISYHSCCPSNSNFVHARLTNELLELEPGHPRAYGNKVYYEGALKKEGGALKQKRGEDGLGDEHEAAEVSIQEEEKIKYWKLPVPQERAMYEQLCRGEETLTDL